MKTKLESLLSRYDLKLDEVTIKKLNNFLESKDNALLGLSDVIELMGEFDIEVKQKAFTEAKYRDNTAIIDYTESQSLRVAALLNILAMNINGITTSDNAMPELIQNGYNNLVFTNEIMNRNKFIKIMCEFVHRDLVSYSVKRYMSEV